MSSSIKKGKTVFSGFSQIINYQCIGRSIDEGYAQLLTERYFGKEEGATIYPFETGIVKSIEQIVGKDKMTHLYFSANLNGLINELSKYNSKSAVIKFVNDLDFIFEYYYDNSDILINKKKKIQESINDVNIFLLLTYSNKINNYMENDEEEVETLYEDFYKELTSNDFYKDENFVPLMNSIFVEKEQQSVM